MSATMSIKSKGMERGTIGHAALEEYYRAKQAGKSFVYCLGKALRVVTKEQHRQPEMYDHCRQLRPLLHNYAELYWDENWEVLELEKQYGLYLDNSTEYEMGLRIDMLVRDTDTDEIWIVDHKYTYKFLNEKSLALDSQMPLYIHALRESGIPVKGAIFNQILTDKKVTSSANCTTDQVYKRVPHVPTDVRIENTVLNFVKGQRVIAELQAMSEDEQLLASSMSLDKFVCDGCAFRPLCTDILEDRPYKRTMRILYEKSDYGYEEEAPGQT